MCLYFICPEDFRSLSSPSPIHQCELFAEVVWMQSAFHLQQTEEQKGVRVRGLNWGKKTPYDPLVMKEKSDMIIW